MATSTSTKTKKEIPEEVIELPEGVEGTYANHTLTLKGPLGKVSRDFVKIRANISLDGRAVKIRSFSTRKQHVATMSTARSIVKNMIVGCTKGFTYRLKVAFAHFPITVKVKGDEVHVENFYGERSPRVAKIIGDSKVEVQEDDVVVTGIAVDDVGQTAANIEQATTVRRKDQRVFLDGVYIYEKRRGNEQ
ncbi:MAG: 50S ribosomal protein L6 [Thaumarchaeota archaeon]|nr:50S ribosomal protein L6 [Nitrososphaerota archaeon]MCL5317996.1 50S ribosomal protein L6 [Nitrososphaerota archaeon]